MQALPSPVERILAVLRDSRSSNEQRYAALVALTKKAVPGDAGFARMLYDAVGMDFVDRLLVHARVLQDGAAEAQERSATMVEVGASVLSLFCADPDLVTGNERITSKIPLLVSFASKQRNCTAQTSTAALECLVHISRHPATRAALAEDQRLGPAMLKAVARRELAREDGAMLILELASFSLMQTKGDEESWLLESLSIADAADVLENVCETIRARSDQAKFGALHLLTLLPLHISDTVVDYWIRQSEYREHERVSAALLNLLQNRLDDDARTRCFQALYWTANALGADRLIPDATAARHLSALVAVEARMSLEADPRESARPLDAYVSMGLLDTLICTLHEGTARWLAADDDTVQAVMQSCLAAVHTTLQYIAEFHQDAADARGEQAMRRERMGPALHMLSRFMTSSASEVLLHSDMLRRALLRALPAIVTYGGVVVCEDREDDKTWVPLFFTGIAWLLATESTRGIVSDVILADDTARLAFERSILPAAAAVHSNSGAQSSSSWTSVLECARLLNSHVRAGGENDNTTVAPVISNIDAAKLVLARSVQAVQNMSTARQMDPFTVTRLLACAAMAARATTAPHDGGAEDDMFERLVRVSLECLRGLWDSISDDDGDATVLLDAIEDLVSYGAAKFAARVDRPFIQWLVAAHRNDRQGIRKVAFERMRAILNSLALFDDNVRAAITSCGL